MGVKYYVTLGKEYRLQNSENKERREICGQKKDDISEQFSISCKLYDLYK